MIHHKPKYFGMDSYMLELSGSLSDEDRLDFFDQFRQDCLNADSADYCPSFPETMRGSLSRITRETMLDVYRVYLSRVHANPEGNNGKTKAGQSVVNDHNQSNQSMISNSTISIINESKQRLLAEGYHDSEIEEVLRRTKGGAGIRDLYSYIKKAIDADRMNGKTGRRVQDYDQRDYTDKTKMLQDRFIRMGGGDDI